MTDKKQDIAIRVSNVSKTFKLPHEKQSSIKGLFVNMFKGKRTYEKQQVLNDISFDIKKGEFFGIVGRNGSGKSTLLKLLAGIYTPDKGHIQVNGKLTPFIELGVGFNPELTGRENVFLNGALLGFNRKEMESMYAEIVEFAELEKFMDQKLKNYSSGMQVRLAFSIAIRAKSDILILDEVLAVGDEAFQQKCISVFERYKANKQTVVLVTHDMGVVERFCNKAIMLKDGAIVKSGNPSTVARLYSETNKESYADDRRQEETRRSAEQEISIQILDEQGGKQKKRFLKGESATIRMSWKRNEVRNVGIAIMKQSGEYVFGPNTYQEGFKLNGSKTVDYQVALDIGAGQYYLKAGLFGETDEEVLEFLDEGPSIMVEPREDAPAWGGITYLKHDWIHRK